MDWKIYTCDCLNNYLTTLELEELDDYCMYLNKKKQQQCLSRTLSVSGVVHLYTFTTKDQKKVSGDKEIPQSHTADKDQA